MQRIWFTLILFCSLALTGCEFVPFIGPIVNAYVIWSEGEAKAYYAADGVTAYNASKRTLNELGYNIITDDQYSKESYYLLARSHNDFKITIQQVEPYATRISIRINFMGDKKHAELIYEKLEQQLDIIDYNRMSHLR